MEKRILAFYALHLSKINALHCFIQFHPRAVCIYIIYASRLFMRSRYLGGNKSVLQLQFGPNANDDARSLRLIMWWQEVHFRKLRLAAGCLPTYIIFRLLPVYTAYII